MLKYLTTLINIFLLTFTMHAYAEVKQTTRIPQFSNEEVNVWKTIIYPSKDQVLKMHRHEYNRVLIALNDGILKITNDKGKVHYLKLEKEQAYYLPKDIPGELHMDENIGSNPIRVFIIELK